MLGNVIAWVASLFFVSLFAHAVYVMVTSRGDAERVVASTIFATVFIGFAYGAAKLGGL